MISIGISEFRTNMSMFLQRVQEGEIISLLLRDKEIAKLVPPDYARVVARQTLEDLRQTAVVGDLLAPLDETWDADS